MANTIEGPRQMMLKNCTMQYAKFKNSVNFRGRDQWELSLITEDAEQAQEWNNKFVGTVKPNNAMKPTAWTVSLNRKVLTSKGDENGPIRVVNADKQPLSPAQLGKIGNGSVGNIILFQGPYDNEFGQGVFNSLTAVQITELVAYEGGVSDMDFDLEGEGANVEGADDGELF